jgi:hypothetical protein
MKQNAEAPKHPLANAFCFAVPAQTASVIPGASTELADRAGQPLFRTQPFSERTES